MPTIKIITPILGGNYYHIFNRGNNQQQVFFTEENYRYFMQLFQKYMSPYVSLLAYSLIDNHFHFLIKAADSIGMSSFSKDDIPKKLSEEEAIGKIISNQFRKFFISYTMAINIQENLKGNLFDRTFKRLEIEDEEYLRYLTFYIHYNPQKHGIAENYREYQHSSWKAYNSKKKSKLNRELLLEIFGGTNEFHDYHNYFHEEKDWIELE